MCLFLCHVTDIFVFKNAHDMVFYDTFTNCSVTVYVRQYLENMYTKSSC